MDSIWLSRTGIIVSTIGGFFVAPELIGLRRIERLQGWLINLSETIRPKLHRVHEWAYSDADPYAFGYEDVDDYLLPEYARRVFWLSVVPISALLLILYWLGMLKVTGEFPAWLAIIIFCFVGPVFVWVANVRLYRYFGRRGCMSLVFRYPAALLYLTGLPAWFLLTLIPLIAAVPFVIIHRTLSGREKLKRILVRIGVAMLISGGILQLITAK